MYTNNSHVDHKAPKARTRRRKGRSAAKQLRRPLHLLAGTPLADVEASLCRRIRAHMGRAKLEVTVTDNRYTMISVRRDTDDGPSYRVRLHHMFADAPSPIMRALARYVANNDSEASRVLGDYIDAHQSKVRSATRRNTRTCVTEGAVHDLREIYDHLNQRYFNNVIEADITWGQRTGKPRRRNSIKMGSYALEDRLIRIHRTLDRDFVPRFFVEWIVYHEMLHQVHDVEVVNGRRQFHTKAFLADEAAYEHYDAARQWERRNLDALLCY